MAIGGVVIQFKADADKARTDITKLTRSLDGVDGAARRGSSGLASIAKAGLAGIAVAGVAAAGALYSFAKAAAADWQEAEKLGRTLKAVPGITDAMVAANAKWIDSMEIATGFSDSEFRNSIGRLAVATGDLAEAQTLAALAADVAAGRNISLASASQLLEKAAAGNTMQLKRQMPWLDLNKDGTITLTEAVKGLTTAYGGAAEAAADNNPWARLLVIWDQTKEALGQFALEPLKNLSTWLSDEKNREALQGWIDKVAEFSAKLGVDLAQQIQNVYDYFSSPEGKQAIEDFAGSLGTIAGAIGTISTSIQDLVSSDWFSKFLEFLGIDSDEMEARARKDKERTSLDNWRKQQEKNFPGQGSSNWVTPAPGVSGGAYASSTPGVTVVVRPGTYSTSQGIRTDKTYAGVGR